MIQLSLSVFWWVTRNPTIHDRKVSKHYPAKRLADGVEQHAPDKYILDLASSVFHFMVA